MSDAWNVLLAADRGRERPVAGTSVVLRSAATEDRNPEARRLQTDEDVAEGLSPVQPGGDDAGQRRPLTVTVMSCTAVKRPSDA